MGSLNAKAQRAFDGAYPPAPKVQKAIIISNFRFDDKGEMQESGLTISAFMAVMEEFAARYGLEIHEETFNLGNTIILKGAIDLNDRAVQAELDGRVFDTGHWPLEYLGAAIDYINQHRKTMESAIRHGLPDHHLDA